MSSEGHHGCRYVDATRKAALPVLRDDAIDAVIEHVVKPWHKLTIVFTARVDQNTPELGNEQNLDRLASLLAKQSF
ncbi:MAG TPA: hypothetical protein VES20_21635 [Bryobacteraceae bacterium]|nr:hypothetical protein [Bryobacteraceae bacterium]